MSRCSSYVSTLIQCDNEIEYESTKVARQHYAHLFPTRIHAYDLP